MTDPKTVFSKVKTVLVIDWPIKEVPESLARAGIEVVVRDGPGPEDYSAWELKDGAIVTRHVGRPPAHAELVYVYRPLSELPGIIETARTLGAHTVWTQSGINSDGARDPKGCWLPEDVRQEVRALIRSAGMNHVSQPYVVDSIREFRAASL